MIGVFFDLEGGWQFAQERSSRTLTTGAGADRDVSTPDRWGQLVTRRVCVDFNDDYLQVALDGNSRTLATRVGVDGGVTAPDGWG